VGKFHAAETAGRGSAEEQISDAAEGLMLPVDHASRTYAARPLPVVDIQALLAKAQALPHNRSFLP
jgi:hypothetical protein